MFLCFLTPRHGKILREKVLALGRAWSSSDRRPFGDFVELIQSTKYINAFDGVEEKNSPSARILFRRSCLRVDTIDSDLIDFVDWFSSLRVFTGFNQKKSWWRRHECDRKKKDSVLVETCGSAVIALPAYETLRSRARTSFKIDIPEFLPDWFSMIWKKKRFFSVLFFDFVADARIRWISFRHSHSYHSNNTSHKPQTKVLV